MTYNHNSVAVRESYIKLKNYDVVCTDDVKMATIDVSNNNIVRGLTKEVKVFISPYGSEIKIFLKNHDRSYTLFNWHAYNDSNIEKIANIFRMICRCRILDGGKIIKLTSFGHKTLYFVPIEDRLTFTYMRDPKSGDKYWYELEKMLCKNCGSKKSECRADCIDHFHNYLLLKLFVNLYCEDQLISEELFFDNMSKKTLNESEFLYDIFDPRATKGDGDVCLFYLTISKSTFEKIYREITTSSEFTTSIGRLFITQMVKNTYAEMIKTKKEERSSQLAYDGIYPAHRDESSVYPAHRDDDVYSAYRNNVERAAPVQSDEINDIINSFVDESLTDDEDKLRLNASSDDEARNLFNPYDNIA